MDRSGEKNGEERIKGLRVCAPMHDPDDVLSYLVTASQRLAKPRTMAREPSEENRS